jgi:hypothetical protein
VSQAPKSKKVFNIEHFSDVGLIRYFSDETQAKKGYCCSLPDLRRGSRSEMRASTGLPRFEPHARRLAADE